MASRQGDGQALRDAARILPVVAALLLLPPLILIFATPSTPGGVPLIVLYIFAIWAALILAARFVARRVRDAADDPDDTRRPDDV